MLELLWIFAGHAGWSSEAPDTFRLIGMIRFINYVLLIFNILPVYPLDGGQILGALLWFPLGEIRSLQIASVIGLIGGACLATYALMTWSFWLGLMAFFLLSRAIAGWQYAKVMVAEKKAAEAPPIMPRFDWSLLCLSCSRFASAKREGRLVFATRVARRATATATASWLRHRSSWQSVLPNAV